MSEEQFFAKIKTLNETLWEEKAKRPQVDEWLNNFLDSSTGHSERLHALHLLSNFIYFGSSQMRELLKAMFRDLYRYPIIQDIRARNSRTRDSVLIESEFAEELKKTRFLGVGNPSESGCHLLYYFRQENGLPKNPFIHTYEIFDRRGSSAAPKLRAPDVTRYVFIDDFCGSGNQGTQYCKEIVDDIKNLNPNAFVAYYVLFAVADGLQRVRDHTDFDEAECVFEFDSSFKCFGDESRYFAKPIADIDKTFSEVMCRKYGDALWAEHPMGYDDCQLLIGFHHNTPDNTLPVIWSDGDPAGQWTPIFRRYDKQYGW